MNRTTLRSLTTISFVCIALALMCAFFVEESHAALIKRGTTTRKEQTVKLSLKRGTCLITVKDKDSWVYTHVQTTGGNKFGNAVNGDVLLAQLGQEKSYTVPIKKAGTYYLYLHGVNAGATYRVQHFRSSGTLKSGVPRMCTSFGDNKNITFYKIKVTGTGRLRVKAADASPRYRGYSKIRLRKDGALLSGEEHLIRGLGFTTTYGVTEGTYVIGVRSSSELYNLTATYTKINPAPSGKTRKAAAVINKGVNARGVIIPGSTTARWYKIVLPARGSGSKKKRTITLSAQNNNLNLNGGIQFKVFYKQYKNGKAKSVTKKYLVNNGTREIYLGTRKSKDRIAYVKAMPLGGVTGTYSISWK